MNVWRRGPHRQAQGVDFDKAVEPVVKICRLKPEQVKTRSLLCSYTVKELEMSGADVAKKLKICNSASVAL